MKRGEVWTAAAGSGYAGKPRPVVIIQDDCFAITDSVTFCGFTTDVESAPNVRPKVEPTAQNGLREPSSLMVDKITTAPRAKMGERIGRLSQVDMSRLERSMVVFLGLA